MLSIVLRASNLLDNLTLENPVVACFIKFPLIIELEEYKMISLFGDYLTARAECWISLLHVRHIAKLKI
ncbi:hypothetical protein AB669_03880 [Pedobacter sp. BMA]|nr:hypothetical protein AB669_03880 [Pedobacter sp. BMA]